MFYKSILIFFLSCNLIRYNNEKVPLFAFVYNEYTLSRFVTSLNNSIVYYNLQPILVKQSTLLGIISGIAHSVV